MSSSQRVGKSFSEAGRLGWEKAHEKLEKIYKERIDAYEKKPNRCDDCKSPIPYKKRQCKFCNSSCAANYNNRNRIYVKTIRTKIVKCVKCGADVTVNIHSSKAVCVGCRKRPNFKVLKKCECGREFFGWALQNFCSVCVPHPHCLSCGKELKTGNVYCSSTCQQNNQYRAFIERWLRGEEDGGRGKYDEQISGFVRRWMEEKSNGMCSLCQGKEWRGKPMPLLVDHINGNPRNTRPENLRMICGNCDMQLETYKGRNKGKGRFCRRERYENGQSY
jgi:hypothetical protein